MLNVMLNVIFWNNELVRSTLGHYTIFGRCTALMSQENIFFVCFGGQCTDFKELSVYLMCQKLGK